MKHLISSAFLIFGISSVYLIGPNTVRIKGMDCKPTANWTTVQFCNLKVGKDRQVKINVHVMIIQPVTTLQLRFQFFRWYSGFKPFLGDFWVDWCKVMEPSAWMNTATKVLREMIQRHSNLNHSCPYYGEAIMPYVTPDLRMIPSLVPPGTYKLVITSAEKTHDQVVFVFTIKGIVSSSEL